MEDFVLRLLPILVGGGMFVLAFRKAPLDEVASKASTMGQILTNYQKMFDLWNEAQGRLDLCETSCRAQAAELRLLREAGRRAGWLTAEVETEIKQSLEPPPDAGAAHEPMGGDIR